MLTGSPEKADELKEWFSVERTIYFGTNESWEEEILADAFTFTEITDEELAVIERLFPKRWRPVPQLGFIPYIDKDA